MSLVCYALLCVHSSFAIILKRKRKLVALLLLSYICIVTIYVMCLFLMLPWDALQCVIVVFPDHTHLLLDVTIPSIPIYTNMLEKFDIFAYHTLNDIKSVYYTIRKY